MRLFDLVSNLKEHSDTNIPMGVRHTLPHAVIFPDMEADYEFYKFVVAMASHPDIDDAYFQPKPLRNVPMAVAYTPQEFEMIQQVAKRMGKKWEEIAFTKSQEPPGGNTVSPVPVFNMTESHIDIMKALYEAMNKS